MRNFTLSFLTFFLALSALAVNGIPYYMNRALHDMKQQIMTNGNTALRIKKREYVVTAPLESENKLEKPWAQVSKHPEPMVVPVGSRLELECEGRGSPPPEIYWVRGKDPEQKVNELKSKSIAKTSSEGLALVRSKLVIDCVTPEDQGLIYCAAIALDREEISKPAMLVVEEQKDDQPRECDERSKPTITFHVPSIISVQGSKVVLPCRAIGKPRPVTYWTDNNDNIIDVNSNSQYTVLSNGDLVIENIDWNNMGGFTCFAKSQYSEDKVTSFLYPAKREDDIVEHQDIKVD